MLQPPVTEVSCGLHFVRVARCVAASESKKNAACLHRCIPRRRDADDAPLRQIAEAACQWLPSVQRHRQRSASPPFDGAFELSTC